jgi:hypothetical protein
MAKYIKPTLKTKFHIDFIWWQKQGRNFRRYLLEHVCNECKDIVEAEPEGQTIDWVDPETAQVFTIDWLWYIIHTNCSQQPDFIPPELPLVASVFRLFIANNNTPLTPVEIHQELQKKDATIILRTLGGRTVYKGIRPVTPPVFG